MLAAAALAYFGVNNGLVWGALALLDAQSLLETVREDVVYQFAVHMTLVGLSPLVAVVMSFRWQLLPLFLLPLISIRSNAAGALERERAAMRDALTGLANRTALVARTDSVLADSREHGTTVALFLLDLDRFKEVNDTLGHPVGDRVLQLVADRLESSLRPDDVVARLGGDEFADAAARRPRRGGGPGDRPARAGGPRGAVLVADTQIDLEASIGIALAPEHGTDSEQLLQRADVAMYVAKADHTGVETYAAERDTNSPDRLGLLGDLRRAVDEGELELHYQPKVARRRRLDRRRRGAGPLAPPDPRHGAAGRVHPARRAVGSDAAADRPGHRHGAGPGRPVGPRRAAGSPVAVNVSMRDLQDRAFADAARARLAHYGVPADLVILEITERVLMADVAGLPPPSGELDALGVRISLDDFGTGYSSLVLLKRLPVQEIKVDRSFVKRLGDITGAEEDDTIVRSIIDLGHSLGLTVVAEGVETRASLDRLRAFGCDRAQGWHLSPALPADEVVVWLVDHVANLPLQRVETSTARR